MDFMMASIVFFGSLINWAFSSWLATFFYNKKIEIYWSISTILLILVGVFSTGVFIVESIWG